MPSLPPPQTAQWHRPPRPGHQWASGVPARQGPQAGHQECAPARRSAHDRAAPRRPSRQPGSEREATRRATLPSDVADTFLGHGIGWPRRPGMRISSVHVLDKECWASARRRLGTIPSARGGPQTRRTRRCRRRAAAAPACPAAAAGPWPVLGWRGRGLSERAGPRRPPPAGPRRPVRRWRP